MNLPLFHEELKRISVPISLFFLCLFFFADAALANDLLISDVTVRDPSQGAGTVKVGFSVSWDNSWRNSINRDAVWVFMKFSKDDGSAWEHATLAKEGVDPAGFFAPQTDALQIVVPPDRKGCFIERSEKGFGNIRAENVFLQWDWRNDGLDDTDDVILRVYGLEMVYVPSGEFYAGDGGSRYAFSEEGSGGLPAKVGASPVNITCANNAHDDIDQVSVEVTGGIGISENEDFPTGYADFYMMKYPITESDWVNFFNTLSSLAANKRDITGRNGKGSNSVVNRNTITVTAGEASTSRPHRAMGYLSWKDLCAFLDWAALRPMTELEYEKAARGAERDFKEGEYAWGTLKLVAAESISGEEDGTETVEPHNANVCYDDTEFIGGDAGRGPLRVGIFASEASSRESAGAGFYGAMDLSGNLRERCVSLGTSRGRQFKGTHGDGKLSETGTATNSDWPGFVEGRGIVESDGSGFRGGSWLVTDESYLAVSDRSEASIASKTRLSDSGGRGVRSAP